MFIVRETKQNRLEPQRGGMDLPRAAHAAPRGLGRIVGRGVAINISPRWGLALAGADLSIKDRNGKTVTNYISNLPVPQREEFVSAVKEISNQPGRVPGGRSAGFQPKKAPPADGARR